MPLLEKINSLFRARPVTRKRAALALVIAVMADSLQLLLGPLGWTFIDQLIDGVAMILVSAVLGFHVLFLPTFVVELVPVLEELPTWTACTVAVIALRKREKNFPRPPNPPPPNGPIIDI